MRAPSDFAVTGAYFRQCALQLCALVGGLCFAWLHVRIRHTFMSWTEISVVTGTLACVLACATRQRWWWRVIHTGFAPAACGLLGSGIAPGWYLLAFSLTFLVYRGAVSSRVPLYLTNRRTAEALSDLIRDVRAKRVIDLGAGVGTIVSTLSARHPDTRVDGIENAPLPWLAARLRTVFRTNVRIQLGNLWNADLANYDLAYAFLSPEPMSALWEKALREMPPGALFVSNSFPIETATPSFVIEVGDPRGTHLFCYRCQ